MKELVEMVMIGEATQGRVRAVSSLHSLSFPFQVVQSELKG